MSNPLNLPNEFLDHYAAALRMEPDSRAIDLQNGIAVKIGDPLWYLCRQWQISEFEGEDAGSPIDVDLVYNLRSLRSFKLRNDDGKIISDSESQSIESQPLEKLIEQEWLKIDWKVSAQIGQEFEKQIYANIADQALALEYVEKFRIEIPFRFPNEKQKRNADENTRKFVSFMNGRVVNGTTILSGLNFDDNSLTLMPLLSDELLQILPEDKLSLIAKHLVKWCNAMNIKKNSESSKSWRNEQLDYHFRIDAGEDNDIEEKTLLAPEYRSGNLDWFTFNAYPDLSVSDKWLEYTSKNLLPTPINIMGISRRWWEFEDANIDFGHIETGKLDIAKALLMGYAMVYGDDWFSIPLSVPVSNLAKINSLIVSDVFGQTESIKPINCGDSQDPMQKFKLFTLTPVETTSESSESDRPVLFVPPVLRQIQESNPLEEVRFLKDEWSNMFWCIENTVLNGIGKPVDGKKAQLQRFESENVKDIEELLSNIEVLKTQRSEADPETTEYYEITKQLEYKLLELKQLSPEVVIKESSHSIYQLATKVPGNWIPFKNFDASVIFGDGSNTPLIRLRRAQMLKNTFNDDPESIQAMTQLLKLSDNPLLWLEENVIPRSGLRISLTNQRTRWIDGQTYVWKGRKIFTGRGEGQSGLNFDKV
jgi:hypothetical protein